MFRKLLCLLTVTTSTCFAAPSFMGIEIGVESVENVKGKYTVLEEKYFPGTDYECIFLGPDQAPLKNVKEWRVSYMDNTVCGVSALFPRKNFMQFFDKLKEKYQVLGEPTTECFGELSIELDPGKNLLPKQKCMGVFYDENQIVNGILLGFTPDAFDSLCDTLSQKYEFLEKETLSSGATMVVFSSDDTRIMLSQNKTKEKAALFYARKDLADQMERSFNQQNQEDLRLREAL